MLLFKRKWVSAYAGITKMTYVGDLYPNNVKTSDFLDCFAPLAMTDSVSLRGRIAAVAIQVSSFTRSISKYFAIFGLGIFLSACDFQRVHQPIDNTNTQKFVVKVRGIQGYIAYKMKRDLETNLAALWQQHFDGTYLVDLDLLPERTEISYGKDATVLRAQERLKVRYIVKKIGTAEPIYEGKSSLASSFNINATEEFSTMTARKAAMDRVLTTLSEEIARDITIQIR